MKFALGCVRKRLLAAKISFLCSLWTTCSRPSAPRGPRDPAWTTTQSNFPPIHRQEPLFLRLRIEFELYFSETTLLQFHFETFDYAQYTLTQEGALDFFCGTKKMPIFLKKNPIPCFIFSESGRVDGPGHRRLHHILLGTHLVHRLLLRDPVQGAPEAQQPDQYFFVAYAKRAFRTSFKRQKCLFKRSSNAKTLQYFFWRLGFV